MWYLANTPILKTPITLMILNIPLVTRVALEDTPTAMIKAAVTALIATMVIAMNCALLCPEVNKTLLAFHDFTSSEKHPYYVAPVNDMLQSQKYLTVLQSILVR